MKRMLLRSPKDPFEVVSPEKVALENLIGSNTGNLLFLEFGVQAPQHQGRHHRAGPVQGPRARCGLHQRQLRRLRDPARERLPAELHARPRPAVAGDPEAEDPGGPAGRRAPGEPPLPVRDQAPAGRVGQGVHRRDHRQVGVGRRPRRVDAGLPQAAGLQRRRRHRLPVDVHVRRQARRAEEGARARRGLADHDQHHVPDQRDGPDRRVAHREVPEPLLHRPGDGLPRASCCGARASAR